LQAVEKLKAQAKGITATANAGNQIDDIKPKPRVSSMLPDDFWDQPEAKRIASGQYLFGMVYKVYVFFYHA
jgi:hypothetical protein